MSVYIKGMEMPCACVFCELHDGDNYWCNAAKKEVPYSLEDKRARFCPLVPVPDHGKLVDLDALDGLLEGLSEDDYNRTHAPKSWERALSVMRDYLDVVPTIIPADKEGE